MKRRAVLSGLLGVAPFGASAQKLIKPIALSGRSFAVEDETFVLSDIVVPSLYGWSDKPEPYAEKATQELQGLLYGGRPNVVDTAPKTRWGERVVIANRVGVRKSLQEEMVAVGAARVSPMSEEFELIDKLLVVEEKVRRAHLGLWDGPYYQPYDVVRATRGIGKFSLVEGVVKKAVSTRSRFYLNFGDDYKIDFTVSAKASLYKRWVKAGYDLSRHEGRKIRVRGFITRINGPMIELNSSRQIEALSDSV